MVRLGCTWCLAFLFPLLSFAIRRPIRELRTQPFYDHALWNFTRRALPDATSKDEHLVTDLPGLTGYPSKHYAGLLTVDQRHSGKLFYWLFEAETEPENKPLVIWLNGGPGCSSMDGLWLENGPLKLKDNMDVTINPYSWHKVANMLYVDQPVGTGYSYINNNEYCDDDNCINTHFYIFLQKFFKLHDNFLVAGGGKTRPLFFSGESHAGHYIPNMIAHIVRMNEGGKKSSDVLIDVQGGAIGNGWIDPVNQYDVSEFAHGVGLISEGQYHALQAKNQKCVSLLGAGRFYSPVCFRLLDDVIADSGNDQTGGISLYDWRLFEKTADRDFPPGHKLVEKYLNRPEVKAAIHASESPQTFMECADPPYDHLRTQDGKGVTKEVIYSLEHGVRMLFFNGRYDVICNHIGNEVALNQLQWSGKEGFMTSTRSVWVPTGKDRPGGYYKSFGKLSYLVVLDAGHMVPLDVPDVALDMIARFITDQGFVGKNQGVENLVSAAALAPLVKEPPKPPSIQDVEALGLDGVKIKYTPSPDDPSDGSFWYLGLVNPGGDLLTLTPTSDGAYAIPGLLRGVKYTFQLIAYSATGASAPSVPSTPLTLGCSDAADECDRGICGYDQELATNRCFCYGGYGGETCNAKNTSAVIVVNSKHEGVKTPVEVRSNEECKTGNGPHCVVRMTLNVVVPVSRGNADGWESKDKAAVIEILSGDLSHALLIPKSSINIDSLRSSTSGLTCVVSFDEIEDSGNLVQRFSDEWSSEESELSRGLLTSKLDTMKPPKIEVLTRQDVADTNNKYQGGEPPSSGISVAIGILAVLGVVGCLCLIVRVKGRSRLLDRNRGPSTVSFFGDGSLGLSNGLPRFRKESDVISTDDYDDDDQIEITDLSHSQNSRKGSNHLRGDESTERLVGPL